MSNQSPPPPPGFWQQPAQQSYSTNYSNQTPYASYAQHPPPPPPAQASSVPPPLYGYNAGSHYSHEAHGRTHPQHDSKRRKISDWNEPSSSSSQWNCDVCHVSLESESALQAHLASHISCSQCSFTASRKLVNGHFNAVHGQFAGSGFKSVTIAIPGCRVQRFNICVGNHPDDVKKWIQERKRKFPRRQQQESGKKNQNEQTTDSALGSLLDGYGSSSSEDDNAKLPASSQQSLNTDSTTASAKNEPLLPEEGTNHATEHATTRPPNYRTRPCKYFMRNGSCLNGDACNFSHEKIQSQQQERKTRRPTRQASSSSTTLLRKLLENDAQREATLSVQLLEYLVDCNYLQKQRQSDGV